MRPFKFFFALSLGLILFGFLARFVLVALAMAAAFSLLFFLGRKIKNFFRELSWEQEDRFRRRRELPVWKDDLLLYYPEKVRDYQPEYRNRTIEVL
jgi:hypothetical protein